jgi:hypothetical protein
VGGQLTEELNNIAQMEVVLRHMYTNDEIDENKYFAGLISIATRYVLLDKRAEATQLISRLSTPFLNDVLLNYLEQDPILRAKALLTAEYLKEELKEPNKEEDAIDLMLAKMDRGGRLS